MNDRIPNGHRDHVKSAGCGVDHRCAGDPDLGRHGITVQYVGDGCRPFAGGGIGEADLPKRRSVHSGAGIGVESVDGIMCGGDEDYVVDALARDRDRGQVERLRVDLPVHRMGEELAELDWRDIRRRQDRFLKILSGSCEIVAIGGHADLGVCFHRQENNKANQPHHEPPDSSQACWMPSEDLSAKIFSQADAVHRPVYRFKKTIRRPLEFLQFGSERLSGTGNTTRR